MKKPCSLPTETARTASAKTNAGVVWVLISSVFAASALLPLPDSSGRVAHLPSFCLFYTLTGLPCPGLRSDPVVCLPGPRDNGASRCIGIHSAH